MARPYKYIEFGDRKQIAAWYSSGERVADIAKRLDMTVATVYREIKRGEVQDENGAPQLDRNLRRAYNPVLAQQRAQESFKRRGKPVSTI